MRKVPSNCRGVTKHERPRVPYEVTKSTGARRFRVTCITLSPYYYGPLRSHGDPQAFQQPKSLRFLPSCSTLIMSPTRPLCVTLIRTHHIKSRTKLERVKKAATDSGVLFMCYRYGGSPALMYGESTDASSLSSWVNAVKTLKYKDFHCVCKPEKRNVNISVAPSHGTQFPEFNSVKEFGQFMERKGLSEWFKTGLLSKRRGEFDSDP